MAKKHKLRARVAELIGPDEEFVAAATAQTGPKDRTMALVSLLLSPIAAILMMFARKSFLVLTTTKETRLYSSSNISPSRATRLKSTRFPDQIGSSEIYHGGTNYRMSEWAHALTTRGSAETDAPGDTLPDERHDPALAANRKRVMLNWALIPITLAMIIGVVAVSWPYINPPNSFTVAARADAEYCSGNNYGQYMAVETTNGTALIIGGDNHLAGDIPGLHRHSRVDTAFGGLISGRGKLKADKVICVSDSVSCGLAQVHSVKGSEPAWTPEEPWDCSAANRRIAQFDKFLCEAVGCRVDA